MSDVLVALSIASPSPILYIITLIVGFILLLVLLAKFPTLRNFRKKQTLIMYFAAASVFGLLIFLTYDTNLGPTVVTSTITPSDGSYKFGAVCQFIISVTNLEHRAANFYLVLTAVNASLLAQNQPDYIQVNSTALKIPFSIPGAFRYQESKPVYFTINENVTGFSIYDRDHFSVLRVAWTTQMDCQWNNTDKSYSIFDFLIGPT